MYLSKEPKAYKMLLANELKKGVSFPKARENALMLYLGDIRKYLNVLSSPNNILGLEYMKSLKKYNSIIKPVAITRFEALDIMILVILEILLVLLLLEILLKTEILKFYENLYQLLVMEY